MITGSALRRVVLVVAALAVPTLPTTVARAGPDVPLATVPCTDPRGCPDLRVDPQHMWPRVGEAVFAPDHCDVEEGATQAGRRLLVSFGFATPNFGPGDLVVGTPEAHPQWFEFAECHRHYHFREYADYRVWTPAAFAAWETLRQARPDLLPAEVLAAHPDLAAGLVAGAKRGFCVIDYYQHDPLAPPKYLACEGFQGISAGWGDFYAPGLPGQYVDITGVRPGAYVLEGEVNAERLFDEADYANNRASVTVAVPGPDLAVGPADVAVAGRGRSRTVTATVHNTGDGTATQVAVAFFDGGVLVGRHVIAEIPAGGAGTASVAWDPSGHPDHELTVTADPDDVVAEHDESNNSATTVVRLHGEGG